MGKSPGRWMKTLIFGKKSSRSKNSKPKDEKKTGDGKEVPLSLDETGNTNLSFSLSQRSDVGKTEENLQSDISQGDPVRTHVPPNQPLTITITATSELNAQNDSDRNREVQAATTVQAALRGHLARRAYGTLKGIIRLQALIRGHLVRRQAISTLFCMFRIVKFQAVARGRKVRSSNIGVEVGKKCSQVMCSVGVDSSIQILKLSSNGFARKILASSPTAMPLHFQYDPNETNSILRWLERWSKSHFWELKQLPKPNRSKLQKPNNRRFSMTNVESIASEFDSSILNLRKLSAKEPESFVEENPELVLERVKRSLRKVHKPVLESRVQTETETETEKNTRNDKSQMVKTELLKLETTPEPVGVSGDSMKKERKKSRRRVSHPVNQELMGNNEPRPIMKQSVPSYMAPTESAKAKLRGQDGTEMAPTLTRRYSLPCSSNAKVSGSPRVQRSIQTMGKFKNDRSLQLSRDGNVKASVNQVEWRR